MIYSNHGFLCLFILIIFVASVIDFEHVNSSLVRNKLFISGKRYSHVPFLFLY